MYVYMHESRVIFWVKVVVRRLYSYNVRYEGVYVFFCVSTDFFLVHPDMAVYIRACPNFLKKLRTVLMSQPLYTGHGYLNKSSAQGLQIY